MPPWPNKKFGPFWRQELEQWGVSNSLFGHENHEAWLAAGLTHFQICSLWQFMSGVCWNQWSNFLANPRWWFFSSPLTIFICESHSLKKKTYVFLPCQKLFPVWYNTQFSSPSASTQGSALLTLTTRSLFFFSFFVLVRFSYTTCSFASRFESDANH
jgi:hypothetical protein